MALYYWPAPPNGMTNNGVTDWGHNTITTWTGERYRGYMTYLAWQINIPNSTQIGIMDYQHYPSAGVTLQGMNAALNREASGRNTSTYQNYFYVVAWRDQHDSASTFHNDVVSDIYSSHVPVVAEVNAAMMPNWQEAGLNINHAITIIGYDDTSGYYFYTDTCGHSTQCNQTSHGTDGQVKTVSQSILWSAIRNITVNQSTGDGGWIW